MLKVFSIVLMGCFCSFVHAQTARSLAEFGLRGKVKNFSETEFQMIERYGKQNESRRSRCEFNEAGCKTEEKQSDALGNMLLRITFEYDEVGQPKQDVIYNGSNELIHRQVYVFEQGKMSVRNQGKLSKVCYYGAGQQLIKEEEFEDTESPVRIGVFKYNDAGQMIEEQKYSSSGAIQGTNRFSYNDKGLPTRKQELDEKGVVNYECTYQYNDKGYLLKESAAYTDDTEPIIIQYTYKYDSQGNWIEMGETMNGKMYAMTIRRIQYY